MRPRSSLPTKDTLLIVAPDDPLSRSFDRSPTHREAKIAAPTPYATSMPHRSAKALVSVAALPFFAI